MVSVYPIARGHDDEAVASREGQEVHAIRATVEAVHATVDIATPQLRAVACTQRYHLPVTTRATTIVIDGDVDVAIGDYRRRNRLHDVVGLRRNRDVERPVP